MPEDDILSRKYLVHHELYEDGEMISQELVYVAQTHEEGIMYMVNNADKYPHPHGVGTTLYMTHPKSQTKKSPN